MRIILVVHQFLPQHYTGTEQLTLSVAKELRRRGFAAIVVTGHPETALDASPGATRETVEGLPVYRMHGLRGDGQWFQREVVNPRADELFDRVLKREKPDLVHIHHFGLFGSSLLHVVKATGIPVVFTPTDFWWVCPNERLQLPDGTICGGPTVLAGNCLRHLRGQVVSRGHPRLSTWLDRMPLVAWEAVCAASRFPGLDKLSGLRIVAALSRRREMLARYVQHIDRVLAPTQAVFDEMLKAGFPAKRLRLLPYGVEKPLLPCISRIDNGHNGVTIGFIGSLVPHKGAHTLLEALAASSLAPPSRAVIYGDADVDRDYAAHLRVLAVRSPIPVEFRGTFKHPDIGRVLAELDVLVIPSRWMENRPLTLLSALLARIPVIVSDVPGMTCEVKNGANGLVVPPDAPELLAAALMRIARDAHLCFKLRNDPNRPVQLSTYVDAVLSEYADLTSHRPPEGLYADK